VAPIMLFAAVIDYELSYLGYFVSNYKSHFTVVGT